MENLNGKTTEEHGEKDFDGVFPADINELLCRILPSPDDEDSTDEEDDDLFSGFSDIFGCIFGNNGNDNEMDKYFTIAHLNKDSKFSPNNGLSYFHRAMFYKKHAKYSRAIEDLTKALQFSPDSDLILYERAEAYRARKNPAKEDYSLAIADYTRVIELNPEYALALCRRGETYFLNNDAENAIKDCNKALSIDPDFLAALLLRGHAHRHRAEYDLAIKDYTKSLQLIPAANRKLLFPIYGLYRYPYYQRGFCHFKLNEPGLAEEDFDRIDQTWCI